MHWERMGGLKFITCDRLIHIKTPFSSPIYLKMGTFSPVNSVLKLKNGKKVKFFLCEE